MSTKRTGTLEGEKTPLRDASGRRYWRGRVRLLDGSLARVPIPEPKCYSHTAARNHVDWAQEHEDATHEIYNALVAHRAKAPAPAGSGGELSGAWYERFHAYHVEQGKTSARDARYAWLTWIAPKLATKAMGDVTRADVEDVRDELDRAIDAWSARAADADASPAKPG